MLSQKIFHIIEYQKDNDKNKLVNTFSFCLGFISQEEFQCFIEFLEVLGKLKLFIQLSMGDCTSSQAKKQFIFPHELQNIKECIEPTYSILPKDFNEFNNTYGESLKEKFTRLRIFQSKTQLQKYDDEIKNNVLAIFCSNMVELKEYQFLPNIRVFDKIILIATFRIADHRVLKEREERRKEYGYRFHKLLLWNNDIRLIVSSFEEAVGYRNVYFCHRDNGRLNRSNLINGYILNSQQNFERSRFCAWLMSQGETDIPEQMQKMSHKETGLYLVKKIFEGNKALLDALQVIKKTVNPALLLHFGWFYRLLSVYIKTNYYQNIEKIYKKNPTLSIWVKLNEQQKVILSRQSVNQNIQFNGFALGYLQGTMYKPPGSSQQYAKFVVSLPIMNRKSHQYQQNGRTVDQGFLIHENRVIFNFMNYYKFEDLDNSTKEHNLQYCPIARQHLLRSSQFRYSKDATSPNLRMMKVLDVYLLNRKYVTTQKDLFFCLKMYGTYKDMNEKIKLSQGSFRGTGSTLPSRSSSRSQLFYYDQIERIGQSELQLGNIDEALKKYDQISNRQRGLTLKQLYFHSQKESKQEQFTENQRQIQKLFPNKTVIDNPKSFLHFTLKFLSIKMKLINNSFTKAQQQLNKFTKAYGDFFKDIFKTQSEDIKSVHENDRIYSDSCRFTYLYILILQIQIQLVWRSKQFDKIGVYKWEIQELRETLDGIHLKRILDV